jgi:hypothetical protein
MRTVKWTIAWNDVQTQDNFTLSTEPLSRTQNVIPKLQCTSTDEGQSKKIQYPDQHSCVCCLLSLHNYCVASPHFQYPSWLRNLFFIVESLAQVPFHT